MALNRHMNIPLIVEAKIVLAAGAGNKAEPDIEKDSTTDPVDGSAVTDHPIHQGVCSHRAPREGRDAQLDLRLQESHSSRGFSEYHRHAKRVFSADPSVSPANIPLP